MKRASPVRKTPLKRSAIKRRPSKQGIPKSTREALSQRSGGRCEAGLAGCTGKATEAHHRKPRRSGDHSLDNLADLCAHCHKACIHGNPFWSYHHGWLVRSGSQPTDNPPIHGHDLGCTVDHYA